MKIDKILFLIGFTTSLILAVWSGANHQWVAMLGWTNSVILNIGILVRI
jgi:hypothetical protein